MCADPADREAGALPERENDPPKETIMTTAASTAAPVAAGTRPRGGYGRLWAGVPRELGFLLPTLPIVVVGLVVVSSLFSAGTGLLALVLGVPFVLLALFVSRGFGMLEVVRLEAAGRPSIPRPRW